MANEIIELYEQGLTVLEIARELSLKVPYVYNVLKDYLKDWPAILEGESIWR